MITMRINNENSEKETKNMMKKNQFI